MTGRSVLLGPADPIRALELGSVSRVVIPGHERALYAPEPGKLYIEDRSFLGSAKVRTDIPLLPNIRMEGWVDAEEVDVLEEWFSATARPNVASHIGLFTTSPIDAGTGGVEVTGGAYARQVFARTGANWGGAVGGAPSTIDNLIAVTFPTATANWGTVLSWFYQTAITVGILLFFAVLTTSKAVDNGDTASFAIGDMTAQLGDPGDSF